MRILDSSNSLLDENSSEEELSQRFQEVDQEIDGLIDELMGEDEYYAMLSINLGRQTRMIDDGIIEKDSSNLEKKKRELKSREESAKPKLKALRAERERLGKMIKQAHIRVAEQFYAKVRAEKAAEPSPQSPESASEDEPKKQIGGVRKLINRLKGK